MLFVLGAMAGCVGGPRIVDTKSDLIVSVKQVAAAVVDADVVALGELHQTPAVHTTHHSLLRELHRRRPNMVIAMEMFERDVQNDLLRYLSGMTTEAQFLEQTRPWPKYARDYRPVIEFAKENGVVVLAANAPRPLAKKASKQGAAAVLGDSNVARETTAPEDDYWDAFQEAMRGHEGMLGPGGMERFYAAQCLKDDTMAESITDYLGQRYAVGDRPLAVLVCGRMHSDHGRGTVQRIKNRMPALDVRVLSAETVADVSAGTYQSPRDIGDFVIVAPEVAREAVAAAKPAADPGADEESGEAGLERAAPEDHAGLRPAFGFMPDYAGVEGGVGVGAVTDGGSADLAGLAEGDIILSVDGMKTPDIEVYTEVLDTLVIGRTATVRIRRGETEKDVLVTVGSRPDRR